MPEVDLLGFASPREVTVVQWSLVLSTLALWKPAGHSHSLVFISSNSLWGLGLRSVSMAHSTRKAGAMGRALFCHVLFFLSLVSAWISLFEVSLSPCHSDP